MVVCKRNWEVSCTCPPCARETERRRIASDGPLSVLEESPEAD